VQMGIFYWKLAKNGRNEGGSGKIVSKNLAGTQKLRHGELGRALRARATLCPGEARHTERRCDSDAVRRAKVTPEPEPLYRRRPEKVPTGATEKLYAELPFF